MSKRVINVLKKKLRKYDIHLNDEEINELGVCGVIELILRTEESETNA